MKLLITGIVLVLLSLNVSAQKPTDSDAEITKEERLTRIQKNLTKINENIRKKKKQIAKEDSSLKIKLHLELENLNKEYDSLQNVFIQLATGVEINKDQANKKDKKTSLSEDLQEILTPVLEVFKEVSQKPRKIEKLKQQREAVNQRVKQLNLAIEKISALNKKRSSFNRLYKKSRKTLRNQLEKHQLELEHINVDLQNLIKDDRTVIGEISAITKKFFSTKGKNILLSLFVFCIIFFPLRISREKLIAGVMKVIISRKGESYVWFSRTLNVIYIALNFLVSLAAGLATLYLLNDWILVTITILLIAGLVWSLKDQVPQFFNQAKLLLNIGTVRQDERIEYKGIFWRVKKLGFYSHLYNPLLEGGLLRVHAKHIVDLSSRPVVKMESWFPSKKGDWVEFDGHYGQVVQQTPDYVKVELFGGAYKIMKSAEFTATKPNNLSQNGYLLSVIFGFDYGDQDKILSDVIPGLQERMDKAYANYIKDEKVQAIVVKFDKANSSSLDVAVNFFCTGDLASKKIPLERDIQKNIVDFCNENGYTIPFNQLTVHMSK